MPRLRARVLALSLLSLALVSCGGGTPPDRPGGGGLGGGAGPQFVISSPRDGASVAGPVFFSVQPLSPADVRDVVFTAANVELTADAPGEDGLKVFLVPGDFDDGALELTATVTDTAGRVRSRAISVNVVADPPSEARVTSAGAVLGTVEENGATSVLSVPPGVADGMDVRFDARTQDEVKSSTGVDYEALGVTFLGAQEIDASEPLDGALTVSSGGFGPMVQPGQAVVNYSIAPDADGDGVGELVVVNSASVAPNGDVISDPTSSIVLGSTAMIRGAGGSREVATSEIRGEPGMQIELDAAGLNPYALRGTIAVFVVPSAGVHAAMPADVVVPDGEGGQRVVVSVPYLPPGRAYLTLVNASSQDVGPVIEMEVEELSAPTRPILDTYLDEIDALERDLEAVADADLEALATPHLTSMRQAITDLLASDLPDEMLARLEDGARMLEQGGDPSSLSVAALTPFDDCAFPLRESFDLLVSVASFSAKLSPYGFAISMGVWAYDLVANQHASIGGTSTVMFSAPFAIGSIGAAEEYADQLAKFGRATGVLSTLVSAYALTDALIAYDECDPNPPPPNRQPGQVTGMGSALPPGGSAAGNVITGDSSDPSEGGAVRAARSLSQQQEATTLAGRFAVKILTGGRPVPFTGVTDASGYFRVPFVPEGQAFTAIATDRTTGDIRTFDGIGPALGSSVPIVFDFAASEGAAIELQLDGTASGTIAADDTTVYTFHADAGDVVRTAVHTGVVNSGLVATLIGPSGEIVDATDRRAQYTWIHVLAERELTATGAYTLALTNGMGESVDYTVGVARIDEPELVVPGEDGATVSGQQTVLGDIQRYAIDADAGDAFAATIALTDGSGLHASVVLRRPDGNDVRGFSVTTQSDIRSASSGPVLLADAGRYAVEVRSQEGASYPVTDLLGGFELTLRKPTSQPIVPGTTTVGAITAGDIDVYGFDAVAGDVVTIALARPPGTFGDDLTLSHGFFTRRLNGTEQVSYLTLGERTIVASGRQTVVVHSPDQAGSDYRLGVAPVESPTEVALTPPTTTLDGTIDVVGQVRHVRFAGEAGDAVTITLAHPDGSALHAMARLYESPAPDRRGSRLGTVTTSASQRSASIATTLPTTGSYVVIVEPAQTGFTDAAQLLGAFELTFETP